jgi:hypothetical protein
MSHNYTATFRFQDSLPRICVVCGESAATQSSVPVGVPADALDKQLGFVQIISLFFGFLDWNRRSGNRPENQWVALPCCIKHYGPGVVASHVSLRALNRHEVVIYDASFAFLNALAAHQAPPTADFLGSIDRGRSTQSADEFLGDIDKSTVESPGEFLKGLGQKPDAP